MKISPIGSTISGITHHRVTLNGTDLHYVAAGIEGAPILLVHGFPESWWTFHKVIPLLASSHRVIAVDLRGFGDSGRGDGDYGSRASAEDLHQLIKELDMSPMHLVAQDISGGTAFRLATTNPEDVASFTAIEMGLAGFGLEGLADITHGGSWHIGLLAAPGIPDMLLKGKESEFIDWAFKAMTAASNAVADSDILEFARAYQKTDGWRGAIGLYQSMLGEGAEFVAIAEQQRFVAPVLAICAGGGAFTASTMAKVAATKIRSIQLEDVGHYAAIEAPSKVANAILDFVQSIENGGYQTHR